MLYFGFDPYNLFFFCIRFCHSCHNIFNCLSLTEVITTRLKKFSFKFLSCKGIVLFVAFVQYMFEVK